MVSNLSRSIPWIGFYQVWLSRVGTFPCRLRGTAVVWIYFRSIGAARKIRKPCTEDADHHRFVAISEYRVGELYRRHFLRDPLYVTGIFWRGNGIDLLGVC